MGVALILTALLAGCQTIAYYAQAVGGHMRILNQQRPIEAVLEDESVAPETRKQLRKIVAVRQFASDKLQLPDNKSYTRFADLDREYVVWNVVATPPYSVEPVESCFVVVGCISYRGFYAKQAAIRHAKKLKAKGLDVYVGGVSAYSTLGWLSDPVLSTMLARSDAAMAGLIFHELAHQRLYLKGDTKFSESFATAVETLGLRQWANEQASTFALDTYFIEKARRAEVIALILKARERMQDAYQAEPDEYKLAQIKTAQFALLEQEYQQLKQQGGGTKGFDRFFQSEINHAALALFGEYHGWLGAFEHLFAQNQQDWNRFYQAAEALSKLPTSERERALRDLL